MLSDHKAVVPFVNDHIRAEHTEEMKSRGVKFIATRSAGFNHIDIQACKKAGFQVARVPEYSPSAVAEFTMGLLLNLTRLIHKGAARTKELNFELNGLLGSNLEDKTVGVIGTGKIGRRFAEMCKGMRMKVICHDKFPSPDFHYVPLEELLKTSDVISLHCPLTPETHHIINQKTLAMTKKGFILLNTSRGALVEAKALI